MAGPAPGTEDRITPPAHPYPAGATTDMNLADLLDLAFANAPAVVLVTLMAVVGLVAAFVARATPGGITTPALDPSEYWGAA
jgi:hypothetical protein